MDYDKASEQITDFLSNYYVEDQDERKVFLYSDQISQIQQREKVALYIEMDHVSEHNAELAQMIQQNALRYRRLFCEAVDTLVEEKRGENEPPVKDALDAFIFQRLYLDRKNREEQGENITSTDLRKKYPAELMRRFEVYFKCKELMKPFSVREIKAEHVGKLVSVRGVVIRSTEVKPQASVLTYTCDTCGCETYQPVTGLSYTPVVLCPSKDCTESRANGRLTPQIRGSKFVRFQEIRIQELSDQVPMGSIPRAMTIYVNGENTRQALPGDTIKVSGVLIPMLSSGFRQMAGGLVTEVFLEAHHIENVRAENEEVVDLELTDEEIEVASQDNFYDLLAYSIAPEIYGHVDVKKSLLLALVGGVDKNATGMRIRGAINIILMGDPGVAKSQLLSYVDRLAARSQYTTGRGSSGVGLTAAVVKDTLTGEMVLEGGALVLADRGICCIDEFDKMVDSDRTAIHEVMEQQTISIAKAGIMTSLNARVSILAAANPAFGRYNPKRSIEENIQLPAALLSRFDLLWLITDKPDRESDKRLAEHITYVHMKGQQPKAQFEPIDMTFIRKYLAVCKKKQPTIPEALKERLVDMYVSMREHARNSKDSTFTSPRVLLAALRLSTALARIRMADEVTEGDVVEAVRLMEASKASLTPQYVQPQRRKEPIDQAFEVIRELLQGAKTVTMDQIYSKCAKKGIADDVTEKCVECQINNGVLMKDAQGRVLITA
ncbi:hypothetical protein AAVH_04329 [Aphelenchoides avenae]|nr:hypothetical protein AAVH_04329 [Aphelenchus avenae]